MIKAALFLNAVVLLLSAACSPSGGQPVFNFSTLPSATSIPMRPSPRVIATLPGRILSFDASPVSQAGVPGLIAIGTSGGVLLYDLQTYQLLRTLGASEDGDAVAWSPDGTRLAIGSTKDYGKPFFTGGDSNNSSKAHLTVWDTSTWKTVFEPEFGNDMVNQMFYDMAWSPDNRSLAFSTDIGGVQVMDTQTGQVISRQGGFAGTVTAIAWSPDGTRLIATNDMAYTMRRWKLSGGNYVRLFDPRSSAYRTAAWSPDGMRIASGDGQGGLCFWTAATNRCDGFVHAHRTATFSLAWSPDGSQLATGGGVIRVWDARTGALVRAFGEDSSFIYEKLQWLAAQDIMVASGISITGSPGSVLRLWKISNGALIAEFRGG